MPIAIVSLFYIFLVVARKIPMKGDEHQSINRDLMFALQGLTIEYPYAVTVF
jgi:hypothetical protein